VERRPFILCVERPASNEDGKPLPAPWRAMEMTKKKKPLFILYYKGYGNGSAEKPIFCAVYTELCTHILQLRKWYRRKALCFSFVFMGPKSSTPR
jgi:hypothetical protein